MTMNTDLRQVHGLKFMFLHFWETKSHTEWLHTLDHCWFCFNRFLRSEPRPEKSCFWPNANNKGADQPAHPRSLISTFVVHYLDSIIAILAKSKILRL